MATSSYFFVFGRTPDLSFCELVTLFPHATRVVSDIARVELDDEANIAAILDLLGGTTKIAKEVGGVARLDAELSEFILQESSSITFGVSVYGDTAMPKMLLSDMKKSLETKGLSVRYISSRDGEPLTSVSIDKKHAQELVLIRKDNTFLVGRTIEVQDYDTWSKRDYGRPKADAKSGMLPLKVSRMIVNIALGENYETKGERQKTLLDPFCGMGTVLAEAYMTGWRVLGSDNSTEAVQAAQENLTWLSKSYPDAKGAVAKIFAADAVHMSDMLPSESVHAIATEPYMGATSIAHNAKPDPGHIRNVIKGLEKLYIGCLRDWHKILAPDGKIVIALPAYAVSGRTYFVKKVVDMCENLGYTIAGGPIEYSRPHAVVKRQFYILRKK
jgi:tRNA G10  N-methylase Trm11